MQMQMAEPVLMQDLAVRVKTFWRSSAERKTSVATRHVLYVARACQSARYQNYCRYHVCTCRGHEPLDAGHITTSNLHVPSIACRGLLDSDSRLWSLASNANPDCSRAHGSSSPNPRHQMTIYASCYSATDNPSDPMSRHSTTA